MSLLTPEPEVQAAPAQIVPDLSHRFVVELDQGSFGGVIGHWQPLISATTLREALHLCSNCLSAVQGALGVPVSLDMPGLSRSFRVWDAHWECTVAWEDDRGRLWADDGLLQPESTYRATSHFGT